MADAPEAAACAYSEKKDVPGSLPMEIDQHPYLEPFSLQTYCRCAPETEKVTCAAKGCKKTFHSLCCTTVSFSYGLRDLPKKLLCPEHHKDLLNRHIRQQIQLKFMNIEREKFLAAKKEEAKSDGKDAQLGGVNIRIIGLVGDMKMEGLQSSIPVTEGGFAQRNVSSRQASPIEKLIKENGYNALAGNLALVEIPYSDDEIAELKKAKLLPKDFTAPQPLVELVPANCKEGGWLFKFSDEALRMDDRRFAIIDGNNRVCALIRLLAEDPNFLQHTSLNAYLVDVNIHNSLQVQLASMKCNSLSHSSIADTPADRIQQYQGVIKFYRKMHPDFDEKKRGALTSICRWVQQNAEVLCDLLPADQKLADQGWPGVQIWDAGGPHPPRPQSATEFRQGTTDPLHPQTIRSTSDDTRKGKGARPPLHENGNGVEHP